MAGIKFRHSVNKSLGAAFIAASLLLCPLALSAKPSWVSMPYLGTWDTGITLATIPWDDITYIAEAFALPGYSGATPTMAAPGRRANLVSTAHSNNTYAILSIGGASADNGAWTSSTQPGSIDTFVANIMTLVGTGTQAYDGIDIDWEFPGTGDKTNFTALLNKLNAALKNSGNANYKGTAYDGSPKKLSFYITPGYFVCGVDWNAVGAYVDFAVLPGYDVASGGYEGPIGGNYPSTDCRGSGTGSYQQSVSGNLAKLTAGGANQYSFPKSKLVLGMPFYNLAGATLEQTTASGSHSSLNATAMESTWSSGAIVNDSAAFCAKMNWAFSQGFQGVAMWELEQAYPRNGTTEVGKVWDVIGGKDSCVVVAGTPTFTLTRTPTRTATRTDTRTATRTSTRTATSSVTPASSATPSGTRSVTPTLSPTQTGTRTATRTSSPTRTGTRTASPSHTPTMTGTRTGSPSATSTPTTSPTRTATASVSPSRTVSVTASPSSTVAIGSPTFSPTLSLTATASPSATASASASPSETLSATASPSPSLTLSPSFTAGSSPTETSSPTATASATPTVSPSVSPSQSPSPTLSPSQTDGPSPTASPSFTAGSSPTLTTSPTATPSVSPSASPANTATASPTPFGTVTASPTSTPASAAGDGTLVIEDAVVMPMPVFGGGPAPLLKLKLSGVAQTLRWKLYTRALVVVDKVEQGGSLPAGWGQQLLNLPPDLPSDLYYLELQVQRAEVKSHRYLLKLMVLR